MDKEIISTAITASAPTRCDCSLEGCRCCDGFDGELKFSNLSKLGLKQSSELLRNVCKNASCKSVNNTNGKKLGAEISEI